MRTVLYTLGILILAVSVLLSLPKVVDLVETNASANNISQTNPSQVAGITKIKIIPQGRGIPGPQISATAALVEDLDSQTLLFVKDPDKRVPIASTTKIMTALVATSYFQANDILTVPENINSIDGSSMGLKPLEKLTFRSILYGMLLNSGNDAAYTIASNFPGGVSAFITEMNRQTASLGLKNTHFDNPAGFDSPYHYSSAYDLSQISVVARENSQLARIFSTKETSVVSTDKSIFHPLKNLNKLLDLPGVIGIKTGTTPVAKENLVGLIERDGHKLLTVILGSDDRFGETEKLIDWSYNNFIWQQQ